MKDTDHFAHPEQTQYDALLICLSFKSEYIFQREKDLATWFLSVLRPYSIL